MKTWLRKAMKASRDEEWIFLGSWRVTYILKNDDVKRESRDSEDLETSKHIDREFWTKNVKLPRNITRIRCLFS